MKKLLIPSFAASALLTVPDVSSLEVRKRYYILEGVFASSVMVP
jgi:hypothetical protein